MPVSFGFGAAPPPAKKGSLGSGDGQLVQPLIVSASGTLSPGEGGVNSEALRNNFGVPFAIDEIRWSLNPKSFVGGAVGCRLVLGGEELTNGAVPVWAFGPGKHLDQEEESAQANVYRWRTSRPIVVMPGEVVEPTFSVHDVVTNTNVTLRVTYFGRLVPGLTRQWLPFVTCYQSPFFDLTSASSAVSKEPDLRNKWGVDLEVERFVGRLAVFQKSGSVFAVEHDQSTNSGAGIVNDIGNVLMNVRMFEGRGAAVVRTKTPFRAVFSAITRSWEVPHVMPPGTYYTVYLDYLGTVGAVGAVSYAKVKADIGLVGWRRVA